MWRDQHKSTRTLPLAENAVLRTVIKRPGINNPKKGEVAGYGVQLDSEGWLPAALFRY